MLSVTVEVVVVVVSLVVSLIGTVVVSVTSVEIDVVSKPVVVDDYRKRKFR